MRVEICVLAGMFFTGQAPSAPLALVGTIELPRVEGRIDHLAFDAVEQRLYVAALGNNTVEVLDAKAGAHLTSLAGFREPQGIAVATGSRLVAVANGEGEGLEILNAADSRAVRTVALGEDADNVRFDAAAGRLWVGFGAGALAAVDPATGRVVGEIGLAGHPESFQLEASGSRIFVNVPSASQIAVVDRHAMRRSATWPVEAAGANFPMALDEPGHRLFIGCRRPARMLVYDTATGKQVATVDIVGDADDLFYDADRNRLYISGGEGYVDVLQAEDGNRFTRLARIETAPGARTSLFVPAQNRLYVAVPHRGTQKAEVRVYQAR